MHRQGDGRLLQEGKSVREVSRLTGAALSSVCRWKQALERGRLEALRTKPPPGRTPKLTDEQKKELEGILSKGTEAAGFATDFWYSGARGSGDCA